MLNLCNRCNVRIIRFYGAAGHGKRLINAIFGFWRQINFKKGYIVADDCCFENSSKICEYLSSRCDRRMSYVNLDAMKIDEKRSNKEDLKIKGCMTQHIFEYSHSKTVYNREYLCKFEKYININFSSCLEELKEVDLHETDKEVAIAGNTEAEVKNSCELDNDDNDATRIYEFTDTPSLVSVIK